MKNIFHRSIFLLLTIIAFSCEKEVKGPEYVPEPDKLAQFNKIVSDITRDLNISSYSYVIHTNKEILNSMTQGITEDQEIPIGSVSNMYLSTLLLKQSEEGLADVNDMLNVYDIGGEDGKSRIKNVLSFTNGSNQNMNSEQKNYQLIYRVLEKASNGEVPGLATSSLFRKLDMGNSSLQMDEKGIAAISSLNDLIRFSKAIDNHKLFEGEDTHELMFRPVYLETGERSPSGLGCFVHLTDERKIIWAAGKNEGYSTLLIKSQTDSLSLVIVAQSPGLNEPFNLQTGDINQSPVYHAFNNILLPNDSSDLFINFHADIPEIERSIQLAFKNGKRDEVFNQLTSYLRLSRYSQNKEFYGSLANLYNKYFPNDIPLNQLFQNPVARIDATMDYVRYERTFTLDKDKTLAVFSTAEFSKTMTLQPWEYDNVEIYFDLNHERTTNFNSNGDDRQFRFDYDFPEFTGTAPTFEDIILKQGDISPTRFNFEIAIPWKTLFNADTVQPGVEKMLGFDIAVADNDGQAREGSIAWHSQLNETPWQNTSTYGTMILGNSADRSNDSICYAIKTSGTIELDGLNKGEWNGIPKYPIDNEFMSGITGPEDQSGFFQVQWDDENIYFLIEVQDDVKRLIEKTGDYGWITNSDQDTVWIVKEENTIHAGGALSNRMILDNISLGIGNYTLHYQTNQSHSFTRWTRERPELSFYGIVLYGSEPGTKEEIEIKLTANSE